MRTGRRRPKLLLTERALSDLAEIEAHSIALWGRRTAARYLRGIESSLQLIRENPGILRPLDGLPQELRFHLVNKHWLVCDVTPRLVLVLTVIHASMDVPARLAELVPQLATEVELLRGQLESGRED